MRLLVIGSGTIVAALDPSQIAYALDNPAWQGLQLAYHDGDAYAGDLAPGGVTPIDRGHPDPPPSDDLLAYAHQAHLAAETGGTSWHGWPVAVSERALTRVLGEVLTVQIGRRADTDPYTYADGVARPTTNADLIELSLRMRRHVGACLAVFHQVEAGISAGAVTAPAQVDAAFAQVDAIVLDGAAS